MSMTHSTVDWHCEHDIYEKILSFSKKNRIFLEMTFFSMVLQTCTYKSNKQGISVRVSQKKRHISFENQVFKIQPSQIFFVCEFPPFLGQLGLTSFLCHSIPLRQS